jgi:alkylresorcinol/alkylpyrone synthase
MECWEAFQAAPQFTWLDPRSRAILKKVLRGKNGIESRYAALDSLSEAFDLTPDTLHRRFQTHAPTIATTAAQHALKTAAIAPEQIDALIISTCTGYLCPGLTSYVGQRLGLRNNIQGFDLVGQGCGAALPNWALSRSLLHSNQARHVLSISVEICSAAFYLDNDPGVLISACLFGDGAGAAVFSTQPGPARTLQLRWLQSLHFPEQRDELRFEQKNGMLRNILSSVVPDLASNAANQVLIEAEKQLGISRQEIATWIWHAGGRDVLQALGQTLSLSPEQLRWSSQTLSEIGNVSSPFVYFALQKALQGHAPAGPWWVSSFGAGFSCHGALFDAS